ncbi:MAG: hypothetical protein HFH88_12350 [Lachnospiraceae bacterium]|nr:hypothetical protein [Lachnospiraceae bacterium]
MSLRIAKSRDLLVNTDETVSKIAEKCGFLSNEVFIRSFKNENAVPVSNNGLRHTAYEDVLAEIVHDLSVKSCPKRFLCFKAMPNQRIGRLVAHCPKELFKVRRKHLDVFSDIAGPHQG